MSVMAIGFNNIRVRFGSLPELREIQSLEELAAGELLVEHQLGGVHKEWGSLPFHFSAITTVFAGEPQKQLYGQLFAVVENDLAPDQQKALAQARELEKERVAAISR